MRRKEERSKQGQTNNKAKQHSTPKAVTFPKKMSCLGWDMFMPLSSFLTVFFPSVVTEKSVESAPSLRNVTYLLDVSPMHTLPKSTSPPFTPPPSSTLTIHLRVVHLTGMENGPVCESSSISPDRSSLS